MKSKNKALKFIYSISLILIIMSTVLFSTPTQTSAQVCPVPCPVIALPGSVVITKASPSDQPPASGWIQKANEFLTSSNTSMVAIYDSQDLMIDLQRVGKEILRQVLISMGHKLLDTITQSTVNWINSGFHGSPLFVQNPSSFFSNIGKSEVKNIINMVGYDPKQPFGQQYALNLINAYKAQSQNDMQSSLNKIINDPALANNYRNNFNYGGWNAFLLNTQHPQNNWVGYSMKMDQTLASKFAGNTSTSNTIQKAQTLLKQGNGFLSPTTCPSNIYNAATYNASMTNEFNPPTYNSAAADEKYYGNLPACQPYPQTCTGNNSAINNIINNGNGGSSSQTCTTRPGCANQAEMTAAENKADTAAGLDKANFDIKSSCLKPDGTSALVATTPGAVVGNHIMTALNLKTNVAGLDAALGNSFSAILNAFMNHFLQQGLSAMGGAISGNSSSASNWSYNGQTLDGTTSANTLTIPTNVSVNIGSTTSTTISGGTAPYSISIQPDSTIATAQISADGTSLTIAGVAQGTTTTTIKDSTSTAQTASVAITVSTNGTIAINFSNTANNPASISASIGNTATQLTLSGGTAPYNIQTQPDSSIAIALVTDNNLSIVGITAGTTSITLYDSSTPAKTITLQVVEGTEIPLVATPTSIGAVGNGSSTNVTISGGTPPYSISTEPDPSVGSALISGNTLTYIGVGAGSTSITIQDSYTQSETLTIPITVTAATTPAGTNTTY